MENENIEDTQGEDTQEDVETSDNNDGENQKNQGDDLTSALAQKKHWKEKYEKLQKEQEGESKEVKKPKTNEDDSYYGRKAFLETRGVKDSEDQKFVFEEAERLKMSLEDTLGLKYIKSELKDMADQRKVQEGMPKGRGGTGKSEGDVDYHLRKGTTPDDLELAGKVIDARKKASGSNKMFSDEMFVDG